ncbi:MAG: DUF2341 domain-containing protein [Thermoplasmata archaeon]|nr:MAG: DUF2341 domain-containing protein [Thermoplasmata archaeon]
MSGFAFGYQVLIDGFTKNFQDKRTITIQGSQVPGANNNFPVLFDSTQPSGTGLPDDLRMWTFGGKVQDGDGYDIVFATGDGVDILEHEIEQYISTDGTYRAWVKVDLTGSNQDIYLYYGSTDIAGDTQHVTDVWSDSYDRVFHFHNGSMASSSNYSFKVEISPSPSFPASETLTFPEEEWVYSNSLWLTPREWEMVFSEAQSSAGQLFWRVRAKSPDGRAIYSHWLRFTVWELKHPEE